MSPDRFRFLAGHVAGRHVAVAAAAPGQPAHTDGRTVFVCADSPPESQRREAILQAALLAAGSLEPRLVTGLRARPTMTRRYLALEGRRALADLAATLPLAAGLAPPPVTPDAEASLRMARTRTDVADPPGWFGTIKPAVLLTAPPPPAGRASDADLRFQLDTADPSDDADEDDDAPSPDSRILKLLTAPAFTSEVVADFLRRLLGGVRSDAAPGAELQARTMRRGSGRAGCARPAPTRIRFTADGRPGASVGISGALHPEWDVFANRYRPDWCRVVDFPLTTPADVAAAAVDRDEVLRRRLSRIGLAPKVLRRRPDGDDLDTDALVDLVVDLRSGYSPPERVYVERRNVARDLGVLILLDASGSAADTDPDGLAVHDHQRRAAATLAVTLEELGDRVAIYAFRSRGRHAVHLPAIKTFGQPFGALGRARLRGLQPANYTRLGAAIRAAGDILKTQAGTPNRLLLVLSDGHPYDDGYEGRYAEADAVKALEELRTDGVACLCLSIGAAAPTGALAAVFGAACHAGAATLAELSPQMDQLFLSSLRELAVHRTAAHRLNHPRYRAVSF